MSPVARSVRRTLCFMPHITMCAAEDRVAGLTVRHVFPACFSACFSHDGLRLCFLLDGDPSSRVRSLSLLFCFPPSTPFIPPGRFWWSQWARPFDFQFEKLPSREEAY